MTTMQIPMANTWYINQTGKLMKSRLLSYKNGDLTSVLVEYLEGPTLNVSIEDWNKLDLNVHSITPSKKTALIEQ